VIEEKRVFPPTLIDMVYEFKSFLEEYIKEGKNSLVRHLNVQYFQFLVLNDVHVLRYMKYFSIYNFVCILFNIS
jgi:hypothetical protein